MRCKRCGEEFIALIAMFYCPSCRATIGTERNTRPSIEFIEERDENDYELIDERGDVVWASDLAKRYRKEMQRQIRKDFKIYKANKHSSLRREIKAIE